MTMDATQKRIKELFRKAQQVSTSDPAASKAYLEEALSYDPSNEQTNLWLAVASSGEERDYYLRRVQEINPNNRMVKFVDVLLDKAEASQQNEFQPSFEKQSTKTTLKLLSKWLLVLDVVFIIVLVMVSLNVFLGAEAVLFLNGTDGEATLVVSNDSQDVLENQSAQETAAQQGAGIGDSQLLLILGFSAFSATLGWGGLQFLIRRQKEE